MSEFRNLEKVSLAALPEYNESMVQEYIYENPEVLDLGELRKVKREKSQKSGGRVDMILEDEDTWYETEIQLGPTDPSHIIRTIEYWDNERWRYPQKDHVAVLIAEEVTGRFFNVISLFNKHIPLIAFQMTAFKTDDGRITLAFSKVLDLVRRDPDDEVEQTVYNLDYWVKRTSSERMEVCQRMFEDLIPSDSGFQMKFNQKYIGVLVNGMAKTFIRIEPQQSASVLTINLPQTEEDDAALDGLSWSYETGWKRYRLKFTSYGKFEEARDRVMPLVRKAAERAGVRLERQE